MTPILTELSVSVSELKKNPTSLLYEAQGEPVAILNHNKPTAYLVPAVTYEWMMEQLDDYALAQIVSERRSQVGQAVDVSLDEL